MLELNLEPIYFPSYPLSVYYTFNLSQNPLKKKHPKVNTLSKYNLHNTKFISLKGVFSKFSELHSHHHNLVWEYYHLDEIP